ncbi:sentrin-specific protease 7b isoform X1 [Astyanax mexicanus]|uniref:sentrin-specific protease 7b isoform X1 n=1 Tax=Astyanax mexicanus TaxID=7994 RepID=UPI0020CAE3A5|nr:sentrin-specific protease 7b isoform X1 [Astyanax mexicanus]
MGSPFKIPKKKQPSDSSSVHMLSPLSRVQDGDTSKTSWTKVACNGRTPHKSSFSNGRIDSRSGFAGGDRFVLSPSHRSEFGGRACLNGTPAKEAGGTPKSRTAAGDFTDQNRWRPRRASDSLCQHEGGKDSPAAKKQWGSGFPEMWKSSQIEHKEEEDDDDEEEDNKANKSKPASSLVKEVKGASAAVSSQRGVSSQSLRSTLPEIKTAGFKRNGEMALASSDQASVGAVPEKRVRSPGVKAPISMPLRKAGSDMSYSRGRLRLNLSLKTYQRIKQSSTEPIVLSSDDEDEEEGAKVGRSDALGNTSSQVKKERPKTSSNPGSGGQKSGDTETSSVVELAFSTLHFGTTCSHANGPIVITEESISIPLKEADGEDGVAVTVVPSELQRYGVWDGALAADGSLLSISQQPSPSLLFLSLSDAQSRLLHTELTAIHSTHATGQPCPFLLVTLSGQMEELQSALLASLMDVIGLRYGRSVLGVPLPWAEGLNQLHLHPRGGQLLTLLGQGDGVDGGHHHTEGEKTKEVSTAGTKTSRAGGGGKSSEAASTRTSSLRSYSRQQSLPRRLIQYPPPPSKGGITVTSEDLECLRDGEFLNDVIIDFYLKYLQQERADQEVASRSHIFSSFFYKQLTRKDNISEEEAGGTAQYRRHRRVKTWTRHVDIFSKDFLFIPVNQEAHWYLVVICFPGLLQAESVPWKSLASSEASGTTNKPQLQDSSKPGSQGPTLSTEQRQTGSTEGPKRNSPDLPDCTVLSCQRQNVTRRPCILIMDSLKLSYHLRIYTLLREYLQVEWEVRRGTPRTFNDNSIKGSHCKVPLQDNSSDCGLYLLQYVESFLQNPVVHFDLPLRLERWFPRQQVRRKREELRDLVLQLYRRQAGGGGGEV